MEPLGFRMARGDEVMRRLITGKSWKKWAVLPVSAMTLGVLLLFVRVAGGPTGGDVINDGSATRQVGIANDELQLEFTLCWGPEGVPPCQGLVRGRRLRLLVKMRSLPPIMLRMVAVVLCPSAGCLHVVLV
jgi:hypothetical protein